MSQRADAVVSETPASGEGWVSGQISYLGPMSERARYYAQDHSRDNLILDSRTVQIRDARVNGPAPTLEREGFALVPHRTAIEEFRDQPAVREILAPEVERLVQELTGADRVVISGGGILRFGEKSPEAGTLLNSYPARFIHIDLSDPTALGFAARQLAGGMGELERKRRFAHYNIWRVISAPPQDVPLAVCDARTLAPEDLVEADAVFDAPDQPEWSFEGLLVRFSPRHRWSYFSNMTRDEALVFKTYDSDPEQPHHVPHTAFDDPTCPPGVAPRASIEMRAIAYWD